MNTAFPTPIAIHRAGGRMGQSCLQRVCGVETVAILVRTQLAKWKPSIGHRRCGQARRVGLKRASIARPSYSR